MSYYAVPDIHMRTKSQIELDIWSYATKKELEHATGLYTSNLDAKKDFSALKAGVDKTIH